MATKWKSIISFTAFFLGITLLLSGIIAGSYTHLKANASDALPTRNFQKGSYEHADEISGERLADTKLVKNSGCTSCPVRCERRVKVHDVEVKGPEYATVGLFGSNIENADLDIINEVNYMADEPGMDTICLLYTSRCV